MGFPDDICIPAFIVPDFAGGEPHPRPSALPSREQILHDLHLRYLTVEAMLREYYKLFEARKADGFEVIPKTEGCCSGCDLRRKAHKEENDKDTVDKRIEVRAVNQGIDDQNHMIPPLDRAMEHMTDLIYRLRRQNLCYDEIWQRYGTFVICWLRDAMIAEMNDVAERYEVANIIN